MVFILLCQIKKSQSSKVAECLVENAILLKQLTKKVIKMKAVVPITRPKTLINEYIFWRRKLRYVDFI